VAPEFFPSAGEVFMFCKPLAAGSALAGAVFLMPFTGLDVAGPIQAMVVEMIDGEAPPR